MSRRAVKIIALTMIWLAIFSALGVVEAQACKLEIVLVLDVSVGMANPILGWNATKAQLQLRAAKSFVEGASDQCQVGVVEYRDQASSRSALTPLTSAGARNQVASSISGTAQGGSNLADGIRMARSMLAELHYGQQVLVVVGTWNPNVGTDPRQSALDEFLSAKNEGTYILTAGVALSSSAESLMKEAASDAQQSLNALDKSALQTWFESLPAKLCQLVQGIPVQTETTSSVQTETTTVQAQTTPVTITQTTLITSVQTTPPKTTTTAQAWLSLPTLPNLGVASIWVALIGFVLVALALELRQRHILLPRRKTGESPPTTPPRPITEGEPEGGAFAGIREAPAALPPAAPAEREIQPRPPVEVRRLPSASSPPTLLVHEDRTEVFRAALEDERIRQLLERVVVGRSTKCTACLADVPLVRYCDSCGAPLAPTALCTRCGREVAGTDRYCDLCGSTMIL